MTAPLGPGQPAGTDATEWVPDSPSPRRYGRYQVVHLLGSGAMGQVFAARDARLGRDVALKVMQPQRGVAGDAFRARFEVEARAAASLVHPGVVQVFDIGWERDEPYLVLELVRGGTLKDRMASGPMPVDEVRAVGIHIGSALAAAHAAGIVHRDVKPANILRGEDGWKLGDFGVAHVPGGQLTMTGAFLGTPAFAAPEALAEGLRTPACDVYSLGATLYVALTGDTPFTGEFGALTGQAPIPVAARTPNVPGPLAAAITATLERDPERRPTAAQLVAMLHEHTSAVAVAAVPPPAAMPSRRPWFLLGAAAVVALVIAVAAASRDQATSPSESSPFAAEMPAGDLRPSVDPEPGSRAPDLEATWQDALRDLQRGEPEDAMEKLAEILDEDPSDAQARALYDSIRDQLEAPRGGKRKHKKFK